MSWKTKRAYPRLCPKKMTKKNNTGSKGLGATGELFTPIPIHVRTFTIIYPYKFKYVHSQSL